MTIKDVGTLGAAQVRLALKQTSNIPDETLDIFTEKLAQIIESTIENKGYMTLEVGRFPDFTLAEVARESGISPGAFPFGFTMGITIKGTVPEIVVKTATSSKKMIEE